MSTVTDIAALATAQAQMKLQSDLSTSVLKTTLDMQEQAVMALVDAMPTTPQVVPDGTGMMINDIA